jgi:hypothetical protein
MDVFLLFEMKSDIIHPVTKDSGGLKRLNHAAEDHILYIILVTSLQFICSFNNLATKLNQKEISIYGN